MNERVTYSGEGGGKRGRGGDGGAVWLELLESNMFQLLLEDASSRQVNKKGPIKNRKYPIPSTI